MASGGSDPVRHQAALFDYLLGLADDRLVLGHRLSEWCGHGPILEEDIALTNVSLDLIGAANLCYGLAGEVEGKGRDADALAYFREAVEFRSHPLVELPRGDYAFTMVRQFLFDAYSWQLLGALRQSKETRLGDIAAKAWKEAAYHLRHSSEWVVRFGDGTEESHLRAQAALDEAWRWTGTLHQPTAPEAELIAAGVLPDLAALRTAWDRLVREVLARATLKVPEEVPPTGRGYRRGDHTEHLGHLLSEMQSVARAHPGASW